MRFDFLEAADGTPLTKGFTVKDGEIDTEPYPHTKYFTSHSVEAASLTNFYSALRYHAYHRHCLLKGQLDRSLHQESRAGHTDAQTPTYWVCLDLDFEDGWSDIDEFIAELNPAWVNTSYIWQHSASAGVKYRPGLRGHLFLMLNQPIVPDVLKNWLRERNLEIAKLSRMLSLTATGYSLRWPLDITTCQNDKLIYIAPPILQGIEDPIDERITLITKANDLASPPNPTQTGAAVDNRIQERVQELRQEQGLPRRSPRYKAYGAANLLTNPEQATVTGVKYSNGFVRLNLDDGSDSWGYYFPEDNPEILYNFKDAPPVRLRDIAPDFHRRHVQQMVAERHGSVTPIAFREPNRDQYFNVLYDDNHDNFKLLAACGSKDRLADFMAQYARALPTPVPDWNVEFRPTTTKVIDFNGQWINLYQPSYYSRIAPRLTPCPGLPPVIDRIITNICVDDETKAHFLNWLACWFQSRERLQTAWIFHGTTGTGKGLLLDRVLKPLIGSKYVQEWNTQQLEEQYNASLEYTSLLWLDEFRVSSSSQGTQIMDKLKQYITEPELPIRAMRTDTYMANNYLNIIVATNHPDPVMLPDNDRRFNVAPAQEQKLYIYRDDVEAIDEELAFFASYLQHRSANYDQARTILDNEARQQMIEASQTTTEQFFTAIRQGELLWFLGFLTSGSANQLDLVKYQSFEQVLRRWASCALENEALSGSFTVTREEMMTVYHYIIGTPTTPAKFSRMCRIYRLPLVKVRQNNRATRGLRASFPIPEDRRQDVVSFLAEQDDSLSVIPGGKE